MSASQLKYHFRQLVKNNKDGSFSTQKNRISQLSQLATQVNNLGYRIIKPEQIKPKHVDALVGLWKDEGITDGVMKNRMSAIRWWAGKVNKGSVVRSDNKTYGINSRVYATNEDKGKDLDQGSIDKIKCELIKTSLMLQEAFGLRREEAIKFDGKFAIKENKIVLKSSWTKGGKQRSIPIENNKQREVLQRVKDISPNQCLIPKSKNYIQQLKRYENQTSLAKMNCMHGLRHRYAQNKYKAITGYECSARGGLTRKEMTSSQAKIDKSARLIISNLLGHNRLQVTTIYLGK